MKEIETVVIVGLGAVGMVFATNTKKNSSIKLYALVDEERKNKYEKNGLVFNKETYNFNYVLKDNIHNIKADLIIIATKSYNLCEAIDIIEKYVYEDTIIISALNGITSENIIAERYGKDKVLLSMLIGSSVRTGEGIMNNMEFTIYFGDRDNNKKSKNVLLFKNFLEAACIKYMIPEDIEYNMWKKFMMNVGGNQITAVTVANYGQIKRSEKLQSLIKSLMYEVFLLAKKYGVKNTDKMMEEAIDGILSLPDVSISSMLQDMIAKRAIEVDIFAKTVCELGEKYNVPTPRNEMVLEILSAMSEKNQIHF